MNVLSLFDGMSCGQIALERLGIPVKNYFASEIKKSAINVTKFNYPNTIHIGDVHNVSYKDGYLIIGDKMKYVGKIDLLIGGSPCQDFSFLKSSYHKKEGYGLDGPKSKLFFEFDRLRKECNPTYFLLENVKMKKESELILNEYLGVTGLHINSRLVSAQNRQRIYWTNINNITKPIDKNILLKDILETNYLILDKYRVNKTPSRDKMWYGGKCKNISNEDKSS